MEIQRCDDYQYPVLGEMLAVAQHDAADVADAAAVHEYAPGRDAVGHLDRLAAELNHGAVLRDDGVVRVDAHHMRDVRVLAEHTVLAVDGDEEARLREREHHLLLLLRGVAGDVQVGVAVVYDLRALAANLVYDPGNGRLVAGYGARGDYDAVVRVDVYLLVLVKGHAVEPAHGLALAARRNYDRAVLGLALYLRELHERALGHLHVAELGGDAEHILHAAAGHGDLALILRGDVDNLLYALDVRGEGGDDDALLAALENLVELLGDLALALGVARALHVRGVGEEGEHALPAELAEARDVHHLALYGRDVYLEVAGVYHDADRRPNGEGHGVRYGVVDVDELNLEAAELEAVAGVLRENLRVV